TEPAADAEKPAENNVSFHEEVISPSISVATTIDLDELEEDELPEDDADAESDAEEEAEDAEEVEEEDADAEEPELPAEILEVITLPEDATPEELVEFYGRRELVEEICLSNGELAQTILETFVANMEVVAKKVLKMKDVSEKAFSIALLIEIDSIASKNQEKEEDAFNAAFNELEEMVKKSAFPQFLPRVEARKALFNFLLKLRKENGQVSDELIEELNVIFPQLAKTAGSPEEVECVLGILIVCQKEQTLELARLVATELEKKEGEEWEPLQEQFQEMIASLEEAMKPIQMEMEEGATLEDMKEKVDAQFTKILASGKLDDEKKWEELENAVAALKEDKLNEYFLWQKDVFSLLKEVTNGMSSSVMSGEEFDGSEVLPKLNELADRAGEIQLTEQSFMLFVQVSAMLMQFGDNSEEELLALVAKLEKIGESVDSENVEAVIEQLKSLASGEDTADDSEDEEIEEDVEADVDAEEDSEEVTPVTTEFVPEEGADADELQKAVVAQITGLLNQDMENPSDALNEFLESVKAQENDDLTAFATWNVNFFQFFFETLRDPEAGKDVNALGEKFTALVVEGTELEAFEMETLLLASRFSMQLISALDEKGTLALADALTNALEGQDYEWVPLVQEDLKGKLAQAKLVGNPLELEAETLDGKPVKIQDFVGKTVLVDVWATWCGPCIGEIPNMKQAYDAYHEAGFEIIGLSIDDDLTALEDFQKEEKLPWIIATQEKMDPEMVKFSDKYGISGIPTMFMVGADGNVITTNARGRLMELLAEIYPDVEVKEEAPVELPDEIDLEEDVDAEDAEEIDTASESTSTTEESENVPVTENADDTTFVAPEGADMQALRRAVFTQMQILSIKYKENVGDALTKFQKSVEAFGNAELTEFIAWNVELFRFLHLPPLNETLKEKDPNDVSENLAALLVSGTEKNALEPESLMSIVRISTYMLPSLKKESAEKLITTLIQTLENRAEPWAPQVKMMLTSRLKQMGLVGNPLELEAETLDGKPVKIQDFVGKTVLIDVWATWCGPCVGEIPNMKKAYDAFHEAGFEIIGLSVDRDVTALEKFQEKEALPWVIATQEKMDPEMVKFSEKYGIFGIPAMFMVGADGNVITINARGRLMEILSEIYPEAAEKAKKAEEEALTLEAPLATPSQSMSTTEEADTEKKTEVETEAETVTDATPTVLDTYSVLPKDESVESLREFLTGAEQAAYEIQSVLREMPEAEAMKAFLKVQETCATAADRLIANSETPADVLKMAVGVKMKAISFTERFTMNVAASDAAYAELVKALEARNAPEMVMEVQVTQLVGLSQRGDRMPTVEDMTALLEKIIEICDGVKSAKCMNGDVMGRFMQMIVFANDCGVATELIDRACQSLRESVVATEDPQLLNTADFITGMARRAALKGKPMELVGVTLDGKEVDIQKDYAGKVVLVDFWATWCNPCVMELRNLEQEYYAKYHEKGFEILGFSIDVDKNQLATFLERRKLPWQTILQKDNAVGCEEPVYYYGIQAIPCLILVGPDGKVICEIPTMRRDEVLSVELKKIYGE
ncbi:MAG: TlpA disulfide reductase family protein, partial [Planctomycetia bacterium]|nr:TlpA disulfide reductase family protein [Planctomycetia bacterium]